MTTACIVIMLLLMMIMDDSVAERRNQYHSAQKIRRHVMHCILFHIPLLIAQLTFRIFVYSPLILNEIWP